MKITQSQLSKLIKEVISEEMPDLLKGAKGSEFGKYEDPDRHVGIALNNIYEELSDFLSTAGREEAGEGVTFNIQSTSFDELDMINKAIYKLHQQYKNILRMSKNK